MKLLNRTAVFTFVFLFSFIAFQKSQAQSKKGFRIDVIVQLKEDNTSMQRYEELRAEDIIFYRPATKFNTVRRFHVSLNKDKTHKKLVEAHLHKLDLVFYAGNDVETGRWSKINDKDKTKDEIWAGINEDPKVMKDATHAILTAWFQVDGKTYDVRTIIRF